MSDPFNPGGVTILREAPVGSAAWQHQQLLQAHQSLEARAMRMGLKTRAIVTSRVMAGDPSFNVIRATFFNGKKGSFEEVEFAGYDGPTTAQIDAAPQVGQQIGMHDPRSKRDFGKPQGVSAHTPERMSDREMQARLVKLGPVTVCGLDRDECFLKLREEGANLPRGNLTWMHNPNDFSVTATWTPYPVE